MRRIVAVAVLAAIFLIAAAMVVPDAMAGWPAVKGHRCWDAPEGGTLKLYIKKMTPKGSSEKRYLVMGRTISSDGNTIEAIHGNAEIKSGTVHMSTVSTGEHADQVFGYMGYTSMDKKTLDGTTHIMGVRKPMPVGSAQVDYQGPITLTQKPCP